MPGLTTAFLVVAVALGVTGARPEPVIEPLESNGIKGLRATFDVDAPPGIVLETLWDVKRFRSIFPDIKSLDVLASTATSVDAKFSVDAVFKPVTYTLRRHVDRAARTVKWRNIGGDIDYVEGSWTVKATADPNVSRVVYTSFVDVGYIVPTGLVRDVAIGKVNAMAERVRAASIAAMKPPVANVVSPVRVPASPAAVPTAPTAPAAAAASAASTSTAGAP